MQPTFGESSRRKVEWANKHIKNLESLVKQTTSPHHYDLTVEQDQEFRNWLTLEFDPIALPVSDAALAIGDTLHNLRSALDILWHEVVLACAGDPTKWTRFPVRDTRDDLIAPMKAAVENQQITGIVSDFILDTIKPYKTGNFPIWALDDLNIRDKHQLIIPVLKWMWITGVRFEDEGGELLDAPVLFADEPWKLRLPMEFYRKTLKIKDKGESSASIFFDIGFPFEGEPVIPSLTQIAEVVTGTVKAFELLFGIR